jgi:hypothetical protein
MSERTSRFSDRQFRPVPAGTKPARCKGPNCGRTIYFIVDRFGRPQPISCDVEGGRNPSETNDPAQRDVFCGDAEVYPGRGVAHAVVCVDRELFRGAAWRNGAPGQTLMSKQSGQGGPHS